MHVWMQHEETGGFAQIAADAVEAWRELGWVECDAPPPPPDPTLVEYAPRVAPQVVPEPSEDEPETDSESSEDEPTVSEED